MASRNKPQEQQGASLTSIAWKQFRKHPLARISLVVLSILYLLAAFADFIAPYPERQINTKLTFQPPTKIHFRSEEGSLTRPYICKTSKEIDFTTFEEVWTEDCKQRLDIKFFVHREGVNGIERYVPFPVNLIPLPIRQQVGIKPWASLHLFGVEDPQDKVRIFLWGSDDLGSDVFGKTLFGARISLTIGIIGTFVALLIGLIMGGIAGYFGGWIDEIIMRAVEALSAIPTIFLLLALAAVFYPLNWPSTYVFTAVIVVLALIGWGSSARSVRGLVYSIKEQEFAIAAKSLGASNWRIITQHILPQTLSFAIVTMSLSIPGYILAESVLSFYGLGIQPPSTSWGLMLSTAQRFAGVTGLTERWWIFLPGLFIFISVLTWNLLGDGLRDAFDPRQRK